MHVAECVCFTIGHLLSQSLRVVYLKSIDQTNYYRNFILSQRNYFSQPIKIAFESGSNSQESTSPFSRRGKNQRQLGHKMLVELVLFLFHA